MPTMRVLHLNCATLTPLGAGWTPRGAGGALALPRMVCHCLLVESEAGLVLVDTGLGVADLEGRGLRHRARLRLFGAALDPDQPAARQLVRLGHRPEDVRHVVLTHLDFDHAGGLADFPHADVHVLVDEYDAAMARRTVTERSRYRPITWAHHPRWVLHRPDGERWFGFERVRQLQGLPPELLLIPLRGHSRGHCGVAVETPSGWLLHAGDAYFAHAEVHGEGPSCPGGLRAMQAITSTDDVGRLRNQARLRALVAERAGEVRVFSSHDGSELVALQAEAVAG